MNRYVLEYFVVPFGAFTCWIFKGFKGSFDDCYNEKKYNLNLGIGMISLAITISTIAFIYRSFL